jgi:hypothetical protein
MIEIDLPVKILIFLLHPRGRPHMHQRPAPQLEPGEQPRGHAATAGDWLVPNECQAGMRHPATGKLTDRCSCARPAAAISAQRLKVGNSLETFDYSRGAYQSRD